MLSAAEQAKQFRSPAAEMESARLALELRRNAERLAAEKEKVAAVRQLLLHRLGTCCTWFSAVCHPTRVG